MWHYMFAATITVKKTIDSNVERNAKSTYVQYTGMSRQPAYIKFTVMYYCIVLYFGLLPWTSLVKIVN